jgi:phosphatidylglycerol---prolipoprotein diacylglyceryl transferase
VITIGIDPVIFSLGHFMFRWYGLIVGTAIGVGVWIALREARRRGIEDLLSEAVVWLVGAGFLGARLFHVIDHWPQYAANPVQALYVWEGGLAIWGAVVAGALALALFASMRRVRFGLLADTVVPGLVLAQAIGRLACIITGDAVGKPTSGPLGLAYTSQGAMVPELGVYYTPTPVYEFLMNVGIFAVLWRLRKRSLPDGVLFLIYLVLHSAGRFAITFGSAYQLVAFGLKQAQLISLAGLLVGLPLLAFLMLRHRAVDRVAQL